MLLATAVLSSGTAAHAALYTWDGGSAGTNQSWNIAGNWNPDAIPTATDVAQFGSVGTQTNILVQPGNAGTQVIGQIVQLGGQSRFIGTSGGASTTPFTGTIQINGVSDGTNNVLISNASANSLQLGNYVNNTTTLSFPNAGVIDVTGTGGVTISEKLAGAGRITKTGSGTLTLSSTASATTGGIQIDGGTASFGSTSSFITTSGGYVANQIGIANDATMIYTGTVTTATIGYAVGIQLTNGGGTIRINNAGTTYSQAGIISGSGSLTKTGPGTLSLSPSTSTGASTSNTYTGKLTISGGIVSSFTTTSAGNPSAFTSDQLTLDGGVFRYTDTGSTINFGNNRGVTLTSNGGGINVNSSTETLIVPAAIVSDSSGNGAFAALGAGTLRLTGANTYGGTTTVGDGTSTGYLRVNGTHSGAGSYFVNANAKLGGLGAITLANGASINVAGLLTPGGTISGTGAGLDYIESLDVANGDVNLNYNGTAGSMLVDVDTNSAGPYLADLLNVTNGNVDLTGATLNINLVSDPNSFSGPLTLISASSVIGQFANTADLAAAGYGLNYTGTSVELVAVPEPTTLAAVLGLGTLAARRRRKA